VHLAVRFLDDVIDVSRYPVPELEGPARAARKVGLGVMGLAEMLATLGVPARSSPSPLPGRSPAPQCRSTTPTAAAVTRTSASSDRRRPEKTKTLILNERWCDDPVPGPSSSGFIGGTGVERDGTRLPPSGAGRPDDGRSAGCVASDHRVSPAHSTTRPARRFPSAGITRVRCWESPSGRSHLASQPSLRTISRGKFPGRVRGPAPPLVSQALTHCPAPLAIFRAGRSNCEGLWPPHRAGPDNVTGTRDLRPWRQANRRPDSQVLEAQKQQGARRLAPRDVRPQDRAACIAGRAGCELARQGRLQGHGCAAVLRPRQ